MSFNNSVFESKTRFESNNVSDREHVMYMVSIAESSNVQLVVTHLL